MVRLPFSLKLLSQCAGVVLGLGLLAAPAPAAASVAAASAPAASAARASAEAAASRASAAGASVSAVRSAVGRPASAAAALSDHAADVRASPDQASVTCLSGYCITSVAPMGDGAIVCNGSQLTEVLSINVAVGINIGYAFPYVTAFVTNEQNPMEFASGFASLNSSGSGPTGLSFVMDMTIPGPGTYSGFASGEGAGLPPSFAPDFTFSFGVGSQSPISVAQGDPQCQPNNPSLAAQIGTAIYGAVLMGPYAEFLANQLGQAATFFYNLFYEYDAYGSLTGLLQDLRSLDDPPDPNYTQLVQYSPLPVLTVPSGATAAQLSASNALFATYSSALGYMQAFVTSYERAWGAEDANSVSWYDQQMNAAAGFATQAAGQLQLLPGDLAAVQQAIAPQPLNEPIAASDITAYQNSLLAGNSDPGLTADLESLGVSSSDIQSIELGAGGADASQYAGIDLSEIFTLGDSDYTAMADSLDSFAAFAATAVQEAPPTITGISPSSGSTLGGDSVTITGTNLASVAIIQFGPSNPPATDVSCTDTSCTMTSPPGSVGTVDVTAIAAGGPSAASPADQFTYQLPPPPTVTGVSPSSGYVTGGTPVTITGTNLATATEADFGAGNPGTDLYCADTSCTVDSPTGSAGTVDVTVVAAGGTSAVSTADEFTYLALPPAPTVTGVTPSSGSVAGGTTVTVSGTSLATATEIDFGAGNPGLDLSCTDTSCTVTSPPQSAGTVDVLVTNLGGTSAATPADQFTYVVPPPPTVTQVSPSSGYIIGGTTVTVTGTNLADATEVAFGNYSASISSCSDTSCTVTSPAQGVGVVDVTVTTAGGTSATSAADQYDYVLPPPPTVTQVSPDAGPQSGGTLATVTGTNLADATAVDFGVNPGTDLYCTDTSCTVTAPPGAVGTVDVTVVGPGGQVSATSPADEFSYLSIDIEELALPNGAIGGPGGIAPGIGGEVWFTEPDTSYYGTVDASGDITEVATPTASSYPAGMAEGPDGRMWYSEQNPNKLVAVDSSGTQTEYSIPTSVSADVLGVAAGPDGRVWFTLFESGEIGAMSPDGTVTLYPLPTADSGPRNIVLGPDGRLWFTEFNAGQIGAITTSGVVTEYPLPSYNNPRGITVGPDGRLWFTEDGSPNQIGAITTSGTITTYAISNPDAGLVGITSGPDGRLWFAEQNLDEIGAMTTSGALSEYATPLEDEPSSITSGPDVGGQPSLSYTEAGEPDIGEITGLPTASQSQPPAITSAAAATFTVGTAGSFTVTTTGSPAPSLSETGALPAGVTFDPTTGLLSGTPAAGTGGSYPVTFTADNGVGAGVTQAFTLTVNQPAAITSGTAATFTVGTAGSFTVTTTGSPAPGLSETGPLPAGLTFDAATGVLSGTPAAGTGGSYPITFTAHNGVGADATQAFALTVTEPPAITSAAGVTFTVGTAESFMVTVTGFPSPTLSETGALPGGVTFDSTTGVLSGTPAAGTGGSYPLTFTAGNGVGQDATQAFTLTVGEPPAFTSAGSTAFTTGVADSFTVTATGSPTPALTESGALPGGVTFTDNGNGTATIAGTPAADTGGSYPITITATNAIGGITQGFTLTVTAAAAITSANTATFTVGTAGTFTVTTTGSPTPALTESGTLPGGVTFTDNGNGTATLAGTPTTGTQGSYPITITASNGVGTATSQSFTLTVTAAAAITSANTATFSVGTAGTFTVTTTGSPTPALTESGTLPGGVTFADNGNGTATIAGTPAAGTGGSYTITITATNAIGGTTQGFTLVIDEAPAITSANSATFSVGTAGTFTVTTTGSPTPALTESGTLPGGVTFADNGNGKATLAGTPATGTQGSYPITITASNGVGTAASQSFTLTVNVNVAPTLFIPPAYLTLNQGGSVTITTTGSPTPSITETGGLPAGLSFLDNGDGTATLSGTPTVTGTTSLTITAANGVTPNATGTMTVVVGTVPAFTSADTATAAVGSAFNFTATTSGYPAPSLAASGLPPGITFTDNGNGTGTLAGTPTTAGTYQVTLTAVSPYTTGVTQALTITVEQPPAITSAASATFTTGTAGTFMVTTTGSPTPALTESGALPSGVTFTDNRNGTATLAGTPASGSTGSYPITITANNGVSPNATQVFTLTVNAAPTAPAITSGSAATFTVGAQGSFTVTTTGSPTPALTESGTLPGGVTFADNENGTATLSGTPAAGTQGSYPFTITAANGVSPNATQAFTLTVNPASAAPIITSASGTTFAAGTAGTFSVTTTGDPAPALSYTSSPALPSGVTFKDNGNGTGTLSGTPPKGSQGTYTLTITAQNSVGTAMQRLVLTVNSGLAITSAASAMAVAGQAFTFTVTTTGTPAPRLTHAGTLPSGITFTANANGTATLSGTPASTAGGPYLITFTAGNSTGTASQAFTLTVGSTPTFSSAATATETAGTAFTFTVTTTAYPTAALSATGLPTGVGFSDNGNGTGTLSGTSAVAAGTYPITLTAKNAGGTATQAFTLTVKAAGTAVPVPNLTSPAAATATAGKAFSFTVTTVGSPTTTYTTNVTHAGTLPAGLSFDNLGNGEATITGTPTSASGGTYPITLTAKNSAGTVTQSFVLTVNAAPTITTAASATATDGSSFNFTVKANGAPVPAIAESGTLPQGLVWMDNGNGTASLAGTAGLDQGGVYTLTFTATNSLGSASQTFTLTVDQAPAITSAASASATHGKAFTFTFVATGYPVPNLTHTGSVRGLTYTNNGNGTATLAGTPATAGTYTLTITAKNNNGTATQTFTLTVS